ncbi:hypothetical protein F5X96DRAFT_188632 [Biscogniauxia mediterranea]|nr:hypothetical protein F5X96DRAFT_188632 [Biscogniauxia mediterranea]
MIVYIYELFLFFLPTFFPPLAMSDKFVNMSSLYALNLFTFLTNIFLILSCVMKPKSRFNHAETAYNLNDILVALFHRYSRYVIL